MLLPPAASFAMSEVLVAKDLVFGTPSTAGPLDLLLPVFSLVQGEEVAQAVKVLTTEVLKLPVASRKTTPTWSGSRKDTVRISASPDDGKDMVGGVDSVGTSCSSSRNVHSRRDNLDVGVNLHGSRR